MSDFGVSVALLTPFDRADAIDTSRLAAHAGDVLKRGADSLTLFGTTGESASIGRLERGAGLKALRAADIPAEKIILGLCAPAVADAAAQVAQGLDFGVRDFLLAPPFYFSPVDDDGLFDWHSALLCQTPDETRFILYHIPQVTGVPLSPPLVARLAAAFPDRIRAVKDSSGDWQNAAKLLDDKALPVLIGDERLLHRAVRLGGAGTITGMANIYPERMAQIIAHGEEDAALAETIDRLVSVPIIPGLKLLLADAMRDDQWERVRAPLTALDPAQRATVLDSALREPAHA